MLKKVFFAISVLICFIGCNSQVTQKKKINKNLSFKICDSIYTVEQPIWWDNVDVWIVDSLIDKSNTTNEYFSSLKKVNIDKYYDYYTSDDYSYKKYFKTLHIMNHSKGEPLNDFIRNSDYYASYKVSAELRSILFNCDESKQSDYLALKIGENYYDAGLLDKALYYFKKSHELGLKTERGDVKKAEVWIKKIDDIKNQNTFLRKHNLFRNTLDSLVDKIEILRTDKWMDKLDNNSKSNLEVNYPELNVSRKSRLLELTDYELALQFLIFNDLNSSNKITSKPVIESVRESFKEFNLISHDNFDIHISWAHLPVDDRDEWTISFWASDLGGLAVANFKRYEFQDVDMVD
ncbi:hypothetical protein [Aquimarina sp. 2201CG5-10]|uniref:hypothetical protein n=1 Tax=Aquimarina callyspongiae TaxID=3098150 RepID=UPI002AB5BE1D|nr:hypothetical protein [Aquimarina sp. 2201CG5-10]MDY8134286.1 hypothetical protein [Aquimarina sp. 2201CG5-10]